MLANIFCWVIALALVFSRPSSDHELYSKLAFALGFILVGTLSKAVDTYREVNKSKREEKREGKRAERKTTLENEYE